MSEAKEDSLTDENRSTSRCDDDETKENQNIQETKKTDNVSTRKRHYSFDDFDESPELPKLRRRFVSSALCVEADDKNSPRTMCETAPNAKSDIVVVQTDSRKRKEDNRVQLEMDNSRSNEVVENVESSSVHKSDETSGAHFVKSLDQQQSTILDACECQCVLYVHSQELIDHCKKLPRIPGRAGMVHSLIEALGLLHFLKVERPVQAKEEEVMKFHSRDYIEFLQHINRLDDEEKVDAEDAVQYGLTYDCPVQEGVYDCAALVAGATVCAARALRDGQCQTAINWCGGWHHAQRSEASGFCYINDIVLGILTLRDRFSRILYVDLDLHHGDGVENAFSTTPHALTVSFHKYDAGFFPGSGSVHEVGSRGGKFYSVNVPLKDGVCDAQFVAVFKRVMTCVQETYRPEAVVCQCGADGLAGDPMSSFNLTLSAYRHCLYFLMMWKLPLLLLGGGGYHHANTARCWASLTALTVGRKLPQDVPDHEYFTDYGPDYELTVEAGNRKNYNTPHDLLNICNIVTENLQQIKDKHL